MRRLLIVSDLHAGRDCKDITGFKQNRPGPAFDNAFIAMIDYYTEGCEDQWKLLLGGDIIDFIEVVVVPEAHGFRALRLSFEVTDEEKEFGLGSESERSVVKLEKTIDYHRELFARLGSFVKAGGELVLVRGNHDVEFHWPKVQRVFRRRLADLAFRGDHLSVDDAIELRNEFQERLEFAPWFYYEPDRIYFEHGHQYDVYCSFDHWLHPVSPRNPRRIDTPISLFAMRYFVNLLTDLAPHSADYWGWKDYFRWMRAKGVAGSLYTAKMALGVVYRAMQYALTWTLGRVRKYTSIHNRRLAEEAERYGIPLGRLRSIDHLHHVPVSRNLPELMRLLFIDRVLQGLGTALLAAVVLLVFDAPWFELLGLAVVALVAIRVNQYMVPRRYLLPGPKEAATARRIANQLAVPLVVMGHSHFAEAVELDKGRKYINTGCWLPPMSGPEHTDPTVPCPCKLSHAIVAEDGQAELRNFCQATRTVRLSDDDQPTLPPSSADRDSLSPPPPVPELAEP